MGGPAAIRGTPWRAAGVGVPPLAWGRRHPRLSIPLAFVAVLFIIGTIGNLVSPPPRTTSRPAAVSATRAPPLPPSPMPVPVRPPKPAEVAQPAVTPAPTPLLVTGEDGAVLPNRHLTPGEVFPAATAAQVCVPGYSASVRNVTDSVRHGVFAAYRIDYALHAGYELDHLVPLELGGDNARVNLWPQPRTGPDAASVKDHLENHLHALVCTGRIPLAEAQQAMEGDWFAANAKYGPMQASAPAPAYTPPSAPAYTPPEQPANPPPVTAAPAAESFANCAEMHTKYPHGVGRPGAVDHTSGTPVTTFVQSQELYDANSDHDGDGDGIACEHR